jgi:hypothetical protein
MKIRNKTLTPKQETFCQAVASGKSLSDAYRFAYKSNDMKAATIQNKAHVVAKNGDVTARIAEIKKSLEDKQLWTREKSVEALIAAYKEGAPSVKVSAVKELNLMHGFNAPIQMEIGVRELPSVSPDEFV